MTSEHAGGRPGGLRGLPVLRQIIDVWLKFHYSPPIRGFRRWRHGRPFWAGVFTALSAAELMYIPNANLNVVIHEGIAGVSAYLMGILLIVMAVTMWFAPNYRVFAGIATLLFAVASLILSNLGGFLLGMLLGIIGGALAVAWTPVKPATAPPETPPEAAAPESDTADTRETAAEDAEQPAPEAGANGDTAVIEPIRDDGSWQRADLV